MHDRYDVLTADKALEICDTWTDPNGGKGPRREAELIAISLAREVRALRTLPEEKDKEIAGLKEERKVYKEAHLRDYDRCFKDQQNEVALRKKAEAEVERLKQERDGFMGLKDALALCEARVEIEKNKTADSQARVCQLEEAVKEMPQLARRDLHPNAADVEMIVDAACRKVLSTPPSRFREELEARIWEEAADIAHDRVHDRIEQELEGEFTAKAVEARAGAGRKE